MKNSITEEEIITEISNENKKSARENPTVSSNESPEFVKKENQMNSKIRSDNTVISYLTNPIRNLISTLCLSYIWCGSTMIYYGMTFGKKKKIKKALKLINLYVSILIMK